MNIKWDKLVDDIRKLTFVYDTENKYIYTDLKEKSSYVYKIAKRISPKLIEIWKKQYNIELNFDMILQNKNSATILGIKESRYIILRDVTPRDYAYFKYLLNHKLNVIYNGIQLLNFLNIDTIDSKIFFLHDMSKFSRDEWNAYSNYFYDPNGYKNENKVDTPESDYAFKSHSENNPHHAKFHVKNGVIRPMPFRAILDMFADWKTMSNFYKTNLFDWYRDNYQDEDLTFHPLTKLIVEKLIIVCHEWFKDKTFIKCKFKDEK